MFNAEINRKLDLIIRLLCRLHQLDEEAYMALDANVQALVDQVTANTSASQAAVAALKAEQAQIADLTAKINSIQPGQPVDAEDLAAIQKATADLQATNQAMQTAVPANTSGAPAGPATQA